MSEFQPTEAQSRTIRVLVDLIGLSGVHKQPEQGEDAILDLLPMPGVMDGSPFCVRVFPDGSMTPISDEEAGIDQRPSEMEAFTVAMRESRP